MIQTHLGKLRYFCSPNIVLLKLLKFTVAVLGTKHVPKSKTHPRIQSTFLNSKILARIQNMSQSMKTYPRIQNTSHNSKTLPRIQNTSQNPKTVPRIQNTSQNQKILVRIQKKFQECKILPRIQNTLGFLDGFFDSGKCFWIVIVIRPKISTIFCGHGVIASTGKSAAWYLSSIVTTRGFTHLEVLTKKMRSKTFSSTYVRIDQAIIKGIRIAAIKRIRISSFSYLQLFSANLATSPPYQKWFNLTKRECLDEVSFFTRIFKLVTIT